jgi:hypothetical protein
MFLSLVLVFILVDKLSFVLYIKGGIPSAQALLVIHRNSSLYVVFVCVPSNMTNLRGQVPVVINRHQLQSSANTTEHWSRYNLSA